ncbi:MAG: Rrf2 family transcriptional regulator [Chloroflexi bacterium]|nr:Rrf2 family transcriptional regulator [Chloroflexota bacterium]
MQIVLGNRGDYTVRAVLYLARHPGRQRRREISEAMTIPDKYLPQILGALVKARIVRSSVGRQGGYELARDPASVTLREVIEVGEGPIRSQRCVLREGPCYWSDKCAMHDAWIEAEKALTNRLSSTTFADLAMADWELEQRFADRTPASPSPPRVHVEA